MVMCLPLYRVRQTTTTKKQLFTEETYRALLKNLSPTTDVRHTFIAPFVAIALNDIAVKNVHAPHNATKTRDCHTPPIPTILQGEMKGCCV